MFSVAIYNKTFNVLTKIFQPNVFNIKYSNEINKAGSASFKIKVNDPQATLANLRPFNRIKIYKGLQGEFIGFIESLQVSLNIIEVRCIGILGLFEKRLYSTQVLNTLAKTAFFNILSNVNAGDNTGITAGLGTVPNNILKIDFSRSTVLAAWQKIATMSNNAEFKVNVDAATLDFVPKLGSDKSLFLRFEYLSNQINTSTLLDFDVEVSGKDTANKITGIGSSGLLSTKQDNPSIALIGLLEHPENFSQTGNATDLGNETQGYLDSHKVEFYIPKVKLNIDRINPDSFEIGDIGKVVLNNGFILVSQNYRIIKKDITVSENERVECSVNLIPDGVNLLPSNFFDVINKQDRRIGLLEGNI